VEIALDRLAVFSTGMSERDDEVDAALDAGGDEEHVQRVTIIDDDPERAQRIADALALDADEAPPTTS
jgi:hypothetical protein